MSFLADPVLLIASGAAIERWAPDEETADAVSCALTGTFFLFSVPVYLQARWTRPIWRTFGARSGRDFMVNSSGLFHFDVDHPTPRMHAAAALIFATYPAWLLLGRRLARSAIKQPRHGDQLPRTALAGTITVLPASFPVAVPVSGREDHGN
ncbi:MAG: hypothetical protein U0V73_10465 [Acidimicrobiia bacterium]